jgi:hypothetical protein
MFDNLAIALQHEHGLLPLFLTGFSGLCWTIVYIDCIRLGIQQKTYAMPFWALALNIAWEGVYSVIGIRYMMQAQVLALQPIINLIWFVLDIGIVYTYFRFGKNTFPLFFRPTGFMLGVSWVSSLRSLYRFFSLLSLGLWVLATLPFFKIF